ncbi:hypothetical protein DASB73_017990 [Starmerella bacillaris]|uniref:Uncharacterized protein n=1 Tax=Starmerella bacillaris TaxID=1247836 RepID=A0AAV5RI50_STABA|nr:hypothetical protein DASB73_017990 [Starmerella bacillaris]
MKLNELVEKVELQLKNPLSHKLVETQQLLQGSNNIKRNCVKNKEDAEKLVPEIQNSLDNIQKTITFNEQLRKTGIEEINESNHAILTRINHLENSELVSLAQTSAVASQTSVNIVDLENRIMEYRINNDHSERYLERRKCLELLDKMCHIMPRAKMEPQRIEENWDKMEQMLEDYTELHFQNILDFELLEDESNVIPDDFDEFTDSELVDTVSDDEATSPEFPSAKSDKDVGPASLMQDLNPLANKVAILDT